MVIAKTASRSVAFKARMRESIVEDQDETMTRRSGGEEAASRALLASDPCLHRSSRLADDHAVARS